MKAEIGMAAGEIWNTLETAGSAVTLSAVRKKTGLTQDMAYLALGWLAREGKVEIDKRGRSFHISLAGAVAG